MYTPIPYRNPNKVVKIYKEFYTDGKNESIITYVDYIDKKNRLIEGYVMFVKWIDKNEKNI